MTRVQRLFSILAFVALAGLAACAGAYTGLSGDVMYAYGLADVAISPNPPLKPFGSGLQNISMKTDAMIKAPATLNYAVYGEEQNKQVLKHGHVIVCSIDDTEAWEYLMETFPRSNENYLRVVTIDGRTWNEHLMFQNAQGDWFSALWQANGRKIPEQWIAKRWSRTYFDRLRVVVEYREPMPECVTVLPDAGAGLGGRTLFQTDGAACSKALRDFDVRAGQAFTFGRAGSQGDVGMPAANQLTAMPSWRLDPTPLVGELKARDRGSDSNDFEGGGFH